MLENTSVRYTLLFLNTHHSKQNPKVVIPSSEKPKAAHWYTVAMSKQNSATFPWVMLGYLVLLLLYVSLPTCCGHCSNSTHNELVDNAKGTDTAVSYCQAHM